MQPSVPAARVDRDVLDAAVLGARHAQSDGFRNADGYDDIVAGDPGTEAAWLYFGPTMSSGGSITGAGNHDFGEVVVAAGDVNGDGRDDVLVGAPDAPAPATWEYAYLFFGHPSGLSTLGSRSQLLRGNMRNGGFGYSMR